MIRRPPRSTRTDTLFPYTTLFRSDPDTGAETEILRLETTQRYRPMTLDRVEMLYDDGESRRMVNRRSGKAAYCCRTHSVTDDDGRPVRRYELVRPTRIERPSSEERRVGKECVRTGCSR